MLSFPWYMVCRTVCEYCGHFVDHTDLSGLLWSQIKYLTQRVIEDRGHLSWLLLRVAPIWMLPLTNSIFYRSGRYQMCTRLLFLTHLNIIHMQGGYTGVNSIIWCKIWKISLRGKGSKGAAFHQFTLTVFCCSDVIFFVRRVQNWSGWTQRSNFLPASKQTYLCFLA